MYKKMYVNKGCTPRKCKDDIVVRRNMAVTPARAYQMAEQGIPVSTQNASNFSDGELNPSWQVPLDRCRGTDPAILWEQEQAIRKKALIAHQRDVDKYGNQSD